MHNKTKDSKSQPDQRLDLRVELAHLETLLADLKVQYEQFFLGILALPPDRLHFEVKQFIKRMRSSPFKSSAMRFQLRAIESRYNTYNTYWQRVLRERENGTYSRDIFKAELRSKIAKEEAFLNSAKGAAEKGFVQLFQSYKSALEQRSGQPIKIDYQNFKQSLLKRSKEFKSQTGAERLAFKVVVKNGKVTVQVKAKDSRPSGQS